VYAGIDAKMAQGKSVLNFDERQHTLSIIASIILVFHFIPLIVYLSRFFDTEEGVKTSLPMLT